MLLEPSRVLAAGSCIPWPNSVGMGSGAEAAMSGAQPRPPVLDMQRSLVFSGLLINGGVSSEREVFLWKGAR